MWILWLFLVLGTSTVQAITCEFQGGNSEALNSGADDVIVARQADGSFLSTPILVQIGKFHNFWSTVWSREGAEVKIYINGRRLNTGARLLIEDSGKACFDRSQGKFMVLSDEWQSANLRSGLNLGRFHVEALDADVDFNVFLYDQNDKFIITDIDGTITSSDFRGHVLPKFGLNAHHDKVVEFFDKAGQNGYKIVYLTARSMAQSESTKEYLFEVRMFSNFSNFEINQSNFSNYKMWMVIPCPKVQFSYHQEPWL